MTLKTTIIVQSFVIKRKRLVPGDREVAATESGARKKAAALASRLPGAAVIAVRADDETGEVVTWLDARQPGHRDGDQRLAGHRARRSTSATARQLSAIAAVASTSVIMAGMGSQWMPAAMTASTQSASDSSTSQASMTPPVDRAP